MTTNHDIVKEQFMDLCIRLKNQSLLTDSEMKLLLGDTHLLIEGIVEIKEANEEAVTWNIQTSI